MALQHFFILSGAGWDGERLQSAALLINTLGFFSSSALRWLKCSRTKRSAGSQHPEPVLCIRTSNGLSDDWLNTINSLPAGPLYFVVVVFSSFHRENNGISMTLWQNGATNRDHAVLRRPPALRRPLSGGTATWRVLKNAVWFEHDVPTHIDRCCRLPSSPPANTDHTHKWLLQARRSETTQKHNSTQRLTPFFRVFLLLLPHFFFFLCASQKAAAQSTS